MDVQPLTIAELDRRLLSMHAAFRRALAANDLKSADACRDELDDLLEQRHLASLEALL